MFFSDGGSGKDRRKKQKVEEDASSEVLEVGSDADAEIRLWHIILYYSTL